MLKEILIEVGSYSYNNREISYNSSENRIEIYYYKKDTWTSYSFTAYIFENNPSLVWGYCQGTAKLSIYDGQYKYEGYVEDYMIGNIACSEISTSMYFLEYTYNTFSTDYSYTNIGWTSKAELAQRSSASLLEGSIKALESFIANCGNDDFSLYNLGFSNFEVNSII